MTAQQHQSDLVKRLREQVVMIACDDPSDMSKFLEHEAANRIEALEAALKAIEQRTTKLAVLAEAAAAQPSREAALVKALWEIVEGLADTGSSPDQWMTKITKPNAYEIARTALAAIGQIYTPAKDERREEAK